MLFKTAIVQIIVWIRITNAYGLWHSFLCCTNLVHSCSDRPASVKSVGRTFSRGGAQLVFFCLFWKSNLKMRPVRPVNMVKLRKFQRPVEVLCLTLPAPLAPVCYCPACMLLSRYTLAHQCKRRRIFGGWQLPKLVMQCPKLVFGFPNSLKLHNRNSALLFTLWDTYLSAEVYRQIAMTIIAEYCLRSMSPLWYLV